MRFGRLQRFLCSTSRVWSVLCTSTFPCGFILLFYLTDCFWTYVFWFWIALCRFDWTVFCFRPSARDHNYNSSFLCYFCLLEIQPCFWTLGLLLDNLHCADQPLPEHCLFYSDWAKQKLSSAYSGVHSWFLAWTLWQHCQMCWHTWQKHNSNDTACFI